jgi:hypothetical protein
VRWADVAISYSEAVAAQQTGIASGERNSSALRRRYDWCGPSSATALGKGG